jgi:hypothetical protein
MRLATYISDLLYRYECVIVPNFGGFVTNEVSAKINHTSHTFYAPKKQLTFNSHLQNNDGLLANYIASAKNISFTNAVEFINSEVKNWQKQLKTEALELENIGLLALNQEGKLIFEPSVTVNYLTSSFGLTTFVSPSVNRVLYKETVKQLETVTPIINTSESRSKTPLFIKYAATAAIIFALGTVGWNEYQKVAFQKIATETQLQQQKIEQSIQEATFVINNPLPAITLNVSKETFNYHIIAGAFRETENAEKKLQELIDKGYNAKILGVNKWNLTQVAYESLNDENEAVNKLRAIHKTESKDAWLLVQEF